MRKLKPNGTIGIIAPGFYPDQNRLKKGIDYLRKTGFAVKLGESVYSQEGYFAGSDALRVNDIHAMFADNEVDAIICARGGWGSLRLLDKLDYNLINRNRKLLIGYSDITSLHLALWKEISLPALSGIMAAVEMSEKLDPLTETSFYDQIFAHRSSYRIPFKKIGVRTLIHGKTSGTLIGGCLSMITAQIATPYSPDYKDTILFIEDINESLYKIDRHLSQLRYAGILDQISGLIIGEFINHDSSHEALNALFKEYLIGRKIPVITNFPYGHGAKKISLPIGSKSAIDTKDETLEIGSCYYEP